MHVQDLMSAPVLTIGPEASLKDVAAIFLDRGVSGLPVVDAEHRVIGVVSEGDILYKERGLRARRNGGPLTWFEPRKRHDSAKSAATTVREAMTDPAVTISPWSHVAEAARLMTEHGVNRLPVVNGDELVGIVTRTDLVRAFTRSDEEIELELRDEVLYRTLWLEPGTVDVHVTRGEVHLEGRLETQGDAALLERLAARIPGVLSVASDLTWSIDERGRDRLPVDARRS